MTNFSNFDILGKRSLGPNNIYICSMDLPVRVRRQDSTTQEVMILEEFRRYLRTNFPDFQSQYLQFPTQFVYHGMSSGHGFIDIAKQNEMLGVDENWKTNVHGKLGEEKVYNSLGNTLLKRAPSLLLKGFEAETLYKVKKQQNKLEAMKRHSANPDVLEVPLSPDEINLSSILNVDLDNVSNLAECITSYLFAESDELVTETFLAVLQNLKSSETYQSLSVESKKEIKFIFGERGIQKRLTDSATVKRKEVGDYLIRQIATRRLNKSQEFDTIIIDKMSSTLIHIEVKSYPKKDKICALGLNKVINDACAQLHVGDQIFNNVVAPAANLRTGWTKSNMIWLPNIPNRQTIKDNFKKLQANNNAKEISDENLKFILTANELKNAQWLEEISLIENMARDEEYEGLLSILLGSSHVTVDCQVFNYNDLTNENIVGPHTKGEVVGIGGEMFALDSQMEDKEIGFKDLKDKHLGHIWNIMFWNQAQKELMSCLREEKSMIIMGDYGGGKTSILVAAALQVAETSSYKVYFILATATEKKNMRSDAEYILDIALKNKLAATNVEVVTLHDIRREYCLGIETSKHNILRTFITDRGDPRRVKMFIDEMPISKEDLSDIVTHDKSSLSYFLQTIGQHCLQVWVALRTGDLKDNHQGGIKTQNTLTFSQMKSHLESKASSFEVFSLELRMRNSGNIGSSALENMGDYMTGKGRWEYVTPAILHSLPSSTVPGSKPVCLLADFWNGIKNEKKKKGLPPGEMNRKPEYSNVFSCVDTALSKFLHLPDDPKEHVVVLVGVELSAYHVWRDIMSYTQFTPILYDGGVSKYSMGSGSAPSKYTKYHQKHFDYTVDLERQKKELEEFLTGPGGILVTHNTLFSGMEAASVLFITKDIGHDTGVRSGILRAVGRLVVIADNKHIHEDELAKKFVVKYIE